MQEFYQKISVFAKSSQKDNLDEIGKGTIFSTGYKLSFSKIIICLADLFLGFNIDGEGIPLSGGLRVVTKNIFGEPRSYI